MPLERSYAILDLSDPNIVLGPRKRRPTERVLENGDPLAKKARNMHASTSVTVNDVADASADKGKRTLSTMPPAPPSSQSTHPTDSAESSDDQDSDRVQAIVVDDDDKKGSDEGDVTDEDDDAELGM